MNTLIRNVRAVACLVAIFALPQLASAAKSFAIFSLAPNSANVPLGTATNITAVETIENGTTSSARFVGPATLSATVSPANPNITVSFNPSTLTFPASTSTMMSTVTVASASSVLSGTYVVSIVINTNPPSSNVIPSTNTFTLNVGSVFIPQKTWTPAGVNTNWSTGANWTATGAPVSSNDLFFVDSGAAGTSNVVDNVVDSSQTIGSLTYGQTNGFHTTLIGSGTSLTVGGDANGLNVGTGNANADGQLTIAAISGGGSLLVTNPNSVITIDQSFNVSSGTSLAQATLDLTGLNTLNSTVSRVLIGVDTTALLKGASGIWRLAATNSINLTAGSTAPQIDIGDNTQANGAQGLSSMLVLGQTNAIFADSIAVGSGKTDTTGAFIAFNSSLTSPSAVFRGTNGSGSRVGTWTIGNAAAGKASQAVGTCDFSLGTVDALVNTMYVGEGGSSDIGYGTLTLNAGTMNVNTMELGYEPSATPGTGTNNVNGGLLVVNTLFELGHGANSVGTLNISGGAVVASTGIASAGGLANINMTGGTLVVTNRGTSIGTVVSPITNFAVANATLDLIVQSTGPTVEAGVLNAGGLANTINLSSLPVLQSLPAQFPVIQYDSSLGSLSTFTLGTLPGTDQGYISNNVNNSSIDLVITNGAVFPLMVWDGTQNGGDWDLTSMNWKTNGVLTTFQQNYPSVQFDDTLTGSTNVVLTTALTPGGLTVNNSLSNYVFTGGSGSLSGNLTFVKSGSGSVALAEGGGDNFSGGFLVNNGTVVLDQPASSISGGTTINGGTVQIGLNDGNGALPSGNVVLGGELAFNRANALAVTNIISGAGVIAQIGTGVTALSGNNGTFAGTVNISQGTLQIASTNAIGATASLNVTNGSFDVNGIALYGNGNGGLVVTAGGAGAGGNGAIINSGASQAKVLHVVTLIADTTFGGSGDWDIHNSSSKTAPADAQLNGGFNLTKVNTNTVTLNGVTIDTGVENINVENGGLTVTASASAPQNSLGDPSATVTVFTNATFTVDTIGNLPGKNIVLTNGGTFKSNATNVFTSQLTLAGPANDTIVVGTSDLLTITTPIIGTGGLSKNGSSTLFLNAANTYSGPTVVSGGTLALYSGGSDGSISDSTNVNVTSGAILDVSGRSDGTLTLASGQTLAGGFGTNGPGSINGILVVSAGATLSPGVAPTNTGVLAVSSNATLRGATIMKLSASPGANDELGAYAITYGGSLLVTNIQGTITNGQTFQLFVASNGVYSAGSFSSVTLPAATGLTWVNNLGTSGSITANVVSSTPAQPHITSVSLSGTTLIISGTNGTAGFQYEVLSSTNVATPLSSWTSIATNTFLSGNFSVTNTVNVGPQSFFILRIP